MKQITIQLPLILYPEIDSNVQLMKEPLPIPTYLPDLVAESMITDLPPIPTTPLVFIYD